VFELSTNDEKLVMQNNVLFTEAPSVPTRPTALLGSRDGVAAGIAELSGNWISEGIQPFDGFPGKEPKKDGQVRGLDASLRAPAPAFADLAALALQPTMGSPLQGKGVKLDVPDAHVVTMQYLMHGRGEPRPKEDPPTIGAFAPK
jgi:hypothetical protein